MKKVFLGLLLPFVFSVGAKAQITTTTAESIKDKAYKIVFQLASNDTNVQKALIRQVHNALKSAPKSLIEVVCHSNGITMLQTSITQQAKGIKGLKELGVVFAACENTLRERKIDKSEIVGEAVFVPSGVIEIVDKETSGWAYLKAGF